MIEYKSYARCGFCQHFGKRFDSYDDNVCSECEVRLIRQCLEDILNKMRFDHDHDYRKDDEDHVRNCAHCEFGLTYETRYEVDASDGDVWCALRGDVEHSLATNKGSDVCDNWQRVKKQPH